MAGVLAYSITRRPLLPGWLFPVAVLSMVAFSLLGNPRFLITEWPLCFLTGCAIPFFVELPEGRIAAAAATMAKYSYGVYLFHGFFLSEFLPRFGVVGAIPAAILTGVTSGLAYRLIESRYIKLGRELTRNKFA
jgi:peptidoglycan/LPS O-acetylase OafA/YrhL